MKTGLEPCCCGHSIEEHGGDPKYPGATNCHAAECECIAYEADEETQDDPMGFDRIMPTFRRNG